MNTSNPYRDFTDRLKLLISKHPDLITTTLGNVFTMRLIGNKTHGDLAEVAIAEFVNQYMYDFSSIHVGKDLFRAKSKEEDITIVNEITRVEFPVSLKAYGDGPLQLSTDKDFQMFPRLEQEHTGVTGRDAVQAVLDAPAFAGFSNTNVLPLIYDEKEAALPIYWSSTTNGRSGKRPASPGKKAEGESTLSIAFTTRTETTSAKCVTAARTPMRCSVVCGAIPGMVRNTSTASPAGGWTSTL